MPGKTEGNVRTRLQPRLRLSTKIVKVGLDVKDLFNSVDAEVVLALLFHKITKVAIDDSIKEAKSLLHDWMSILLLYYNNDKRIIPRILSGSVPSASSPSSSLVKRASNLDLTFSRSESMKPIPRLIFGFLKSPLLNADLDHDSWAFLHSQMRSLLFSSWSSR